MTEPFARLRHLLRELKRRRVYRVAAGYLVAAFVVLQLATMAGDAFGFPGWFEPMIWVVAGLGFPLLSPPSRMELGRRFKTSKIRQVVR